MTVVELVELLGRIDHGIAVLEVQHDMTPGAATLLSALAHLRGAHEALRLYIDGRRAAGVRNPYGRTP